ncbi:phosphodiester glycosidase family protein [Paracoccaceae bacterium]
MRGLALCLGLLVPQAALAVTCRDLSFEGAGYTACEVTPAEDTRLFLYGAGGPFGTFAALETALRAQGLTLEFAMNAGMFHEDFAPVGLYVEDGKEGHPLVTSAGPGNFGMLPNGVFCIGGVRPFAVMESKAFAEAMPACRHATQSGPMLVIGGTLHPRFIPGSDSLKYRNGVGVSADGQRAVFVISDGRVNFDSFGRLFRDVLQLPEALYLDGSISRLYAPQIGRDDGGWPMGPMVAVVRAKE